MCYLVSKSFLSCYLNVEKSRRCSDLLDLPKPSFEYMIKNVILFCLLAVSACVYVCTSMHIHTRSPGAQIRIVHFLICLCSILQYSCRWTWKSKHLNSGFARQTQSALLHFFSIITAMWANYLELLLLELNVSNYYNFSSEGFSHYCNTSFWGIMKHCLLFKKRNLTLYIHLEVKFTSRGCFA